METRATSRTGDWPLIGRDRELEQIATALRAGTAGRRTHYQVHYHS